MDFSIVQPDFLFLASARWLSINYQHKVLVSGFGCQKGERLKP